MFTPGPWITSGEKATKIYAYDLGRGKPAEYIGQCDARLAGEDDRYKNLANARLIAACPTMADYVIMRAKEGDKNAQEIADTAGLTIA